MDTNKQPPFDVDSPEIQQACHVIARTLLGLADRREVKETVKAVMVAGLRWRETSHPREELE